MRLSRLARIALNSPEKTWADRRRIVERACEYTDNVRDPRWWRKPTSFQREGANPFRCGGDELLKLALQHPPTTRGSRVTEFSWLLFSIFLVQTDPME